MNKVIHNSSFICHHHFQNYAMPQARAARWRRRRQAMAEWRLRRSQWRCSLGSLKGSQSFGPGVPRVPDLRHCLLPQRHLAMAWRRRRQRAALACGMA